MQSEFISLLMMQPQQPLRSLIFESRFLPFSVALHAELAYPAFYFSSFAQTGCRSLVQDICISGSLCGALQFVVACERTPEC